jgi:hypothetical protein
MYWLIVVTWMSGGVQHKVELITPMTDRASCEMLAEERVASIKRTYPDAKTIMYICEEATL